VPPLPKAQLTALYIARLSDFISYQYTLFPFINKFLTTLHVTDDASEIGFYSGIMSTSSVPQVITIFHWAKFSDILDRQTIILVGTLGLAVVSLLAAAWTSSHICADPRSGLLARNASVFQAVPAELTDSTNQAGAYSIYGCIYPLGSTVGPLIGGFFFSNMATKYPDYFDFKFLEEHHYFMPELICALLASLLNGFILACLFLEEVHLN
ncbi:hypothetical protein DFH08DRAFT_633189, partial [Mycena albidolilacea]